MKDFNQKRSRHFLQTNFRSKKKRRPFFFFEYRWIPTKSHLRNTLLGVLKVPLEVPLFMVLTTWEAAFFPKSKMVWSVQYFFWARSILRSLKACAAKLHSLHSDDPMGCVPWTKGACRSFFLRFHSCQHGSLQDELPAKVVTSDKCFRVDMHISYSGLKVWKAPGLNENENIFKNNGTYSSEIILKKPSVVQTDVLPSLFLSFWSVFPFLWEPTQSPKAKMIHRSFTPDVLSYNSALHGCARAGHMAASITSLWSDSGSGLGAFCVGATQKYVKHPFLAHISIKIKWIR